jgi:hypothetical protein
MPSIVTDPAVAQFVERVSNGVDSAADSIAGLMMRLVGRVANLERKLATQDSRIDKLARQPKPVRKPPSVRVVESGIDVRDGGPVYIEQRIRRSRGRPKGSRDSYVRPTRSRHRIEAEGISPHLLDRDWDDDLGE